MAGSPQPKLRVEYTDNFPSRTLLSDWRDSSGRPLVEQFSISTLGGNDVVEFVEGPNALDVRDLIARSDDWVAVLEGGAGNDLLKGTPGRDRIDGGAGSDTLYGLGGDDRPERLVPLRMPAVASTATGLPRRCGNSLPTDSSRRPLTKAMAPRAFSVAGRRSAVRCVCGSQRRHSGQSQFRPPLR